MRKRVPVSAVFPGMLKVVRSLIRIRNAPDVMYMAQATIDCRMESALVGAPLPAVMNVVTHNPVHNKAATSVATLLCTMKWAILFI